MKRILLHAVVLLACACVPAAAQDGPTRDLRGLGVSAGSRVRLVALGVSPDPMVGRVADLTADSLLLARGDARVQLDTRQVRTMSVSAGHNRWRWALPGAVVGMLVGGLVGGTAAGYDDQTGLAGFAGFVAGAIVGIPVGAGVGAAVAPERWTPVPLPLPLPLPLVGR